LLVEEDPLNDLDSLYCDADVKFLVVPTTEEAVLEVLEAIFEEEADVDDKERLPLLGDLVNKVPKINKMNNGNQSSFYFIYILLDSSLDCFFVGIKDFC